MKKIILFLYFSFLLVFYAEAQTNGGSAYLVGYSSISTSSTHPANDVADFSALKISGSVFTIEAWIFPIYTPNIDEEQILIRFYSYENYFNQFNSYKLSLIHPGGDISPGIQFNVSDCADPENIGQIQATESIVPESWNHIAASYDGSFLRIYINGLSKAEISFSGTIGYLGTTDSEVFELGMANGLIDDVRLWNTTRTQSEIATNMNIQLNGNEPGLAGYWPLDEEIDYVTVDLTENLNDLHAHNQFVSTMPQSTPGSIAHLVVDTSPLDFGLAEMNEYSIEKEIEIQNSGDAPLYGEVSILNEHILLHPYKIRYFLDPGAIDTVFFRLRPLIKEQINSTIDFNIGNADNQGIQIPFFVEGVRELGIDANNIDMWIHPNGVFAHNYHFGNSGLEWPIYSGKHVVYSSGIWVGAKVGEEIHTAISAKSSGIEEFAPGPIDESGQAGDPLDPKFRVYKIHLGDDNINPDYAEWPADLGAPLDQNDNPQHLADQTMFVVYNDLNADNHSRIGSTPLGAEIQQTIFAWDDESELGNNVFLRFKVINKSNDAWEDTYFALWSDPDVGFYGNDFVGIDVDKNMGYAYNGSNFDDIYGSGPPAVGYDILKGAYYTKPIQAFAYYDYTLPDEFNEPDTGPECYNYLQGLSRYGNPYYDPIANKDTHFALNGDPVTETGWIDSNQGDRRFLLSTGPFDLQPGQAKEIVAAIIVARDSTGDDRDFLNSITALKTASDIIQAKFDEGKLFGGAVENVTVEEVAAGETAIVDDLDNSGAQLAVTAGQDGATVEIASYIDAPPGADVINQSAIHGVGKYLDILVNGDVEWPIDIRIYYTQNDLDEAGVLEDDLEGVYYWRNVAPEDWYLYSKSRAMGDDPVDIGVDSSETEVIKSPDGTYLGYVMAKAYHLTMMRIGTKLDSSLIGIHPDDLIGVKDFHLRQNFPNPFNPLTTIEYSVSTQSEVNLSVYNILGERIATLDYGIKANGVYKLMWNASSLPSGVYFVRMYCISMASNRQFTDIKKMILMK